MSDPSILDIAFLRRQTMNDVALERELLALLDQQCRSLLPILAAPGDSREKREAAHSLRGAAAGLGAIRLAATAAALEEGRAPVIGIVRAIGELQAVIETLLARRVA